jgi:hypothetical protein
MTKTITITLKKASFIVSEYANDPIKESNDFLNSFKNQVDISLKELENYIGFELSESDLLIIGV